MLRSIGKQSGGPMESVVKLTSKIGGPRRLPSLPMPKAGSDDSPDFYCYCWAYPLSLFSFFLFFTFQLSFPCGRLSWLVSAVERTLKIASRIVYRIVALVRFRPSVVFAAARSLSRPRTVCFLVSLKYGGVVRPGTICQVSRQPPENR